MLKDGKSPWMYKSKEILKVVGKEMLEAGSESAGCLGLMKILRKGGLEGSWICSRNDNDRNIASC
jgi:hypothetical protein